MDLTKVTIGALLHDVGKVIHRSAAQDGRAHSVSGRDFVREFTKDKNVLESIGFHHKASLKNAELEASSPAFIVYAADNIASGADRRDYEEGEVGHKGFCKDLPLESVFNLVNNGNRKLKVNLSDMKSINFPIENAKAVESAYNEIFQKLKEGLKGISFDESFVNSLLELLEATLSYVPSSTSTEQVADISLYDHLKICAAIAGCIYQYLTEQGRNNFKKELFDNEKSFYDEKAFIMFSGDMSGIQQFIYTISSEDALKSLRSRSFYLEILMENLVDEVLRETGLSRANLIYSGGGHFYMLLPNTQTGREIIGFVENKVNDWLLKRFKAALYIAVGFIPCSANELMNFPVEGERSPYKEIFERLNKIVGEKKLRRYDGKTIKKLNSSSFNSEGRECKVCGTADNLVNDGDKYSCTLCNGLIKISPMLVNEDNILMVTNEKVKDMVNLELPALEGKSCFLNPVSREKALELQKENPQCIERIYGKNKMYTGLNYASKLWIGTYHTQNGDGNMATFEELAKSSKGIERIAVLRADVDDLGRAFRKGFERNEMSERFRYVTISRYATLSRQLSLFFKKHINEIFSADYGLERFYLNEGSKDKKVTIVYSGGDDVFIVGAWNEVIEAAVDLRNAFKKFTGGALTFSAGIGFFERSYPVSRMAKEVEDLEQAAKGLDNKDGISIFGRELVLQDGKWQAQEKHTYHWDIFLNKVVGEKLRLIQKYFRTLSGEERGKGNSFLYRLMDYIVKAQDKINIARFAYLLGKMAPRKEASEEIKRVYSEFSRCMYNWISSGSDRSQLLTAIHIYIYLNREKKEENREAN